MLLFISFWYHCNLLSCIISLLGNKKHRVYPLSVQIEDHILEGTNVDTSAE